MSIYLIYGLILLSGFAALLYQVVWQKYLAILLGGTASASALVLSGFFIFLCLGYSLFGRILPRLSQSRLLLYAYIELGIGLYGFVSPNLFSWIKDIYWQSGFVDQPLLSGIILVILFMAVPVLLMGGTIPVLAEGLSRSFDKSHSVHARIYGLNTLGGFLGAFATTFFLIEQFGLPFCLLIGASLNILVFLLSWVVDKKTTTHSAPPQEDMAGHDLNQKQRWLVYFVSFLSGFYVFSFENLIIRMSSMALGSTVYSYGMVVSAFIVSIAIGSYLAEKVDTFREPKRLIQVQLTLFLGCIALYFSIPYWPDFFYLLRASINPYPSHFWLYNQLVFLFMTLILIWPVAMMGMSLPLLFGYMRGRQIRISTLVGRLYAANSVGAMLGALVGGYLLFHFLNAEQIFKINLLLIILSLVIFNHLQMTRGAKRLLPLIGLLVLLLPSWPLDRFLPSRAYLYPTLAVKNENSSFSGYLKSLEKIQRKPLFVQEDPELHVAVMDFANTDDLGVLYPETGLYLNGKSESSFPSDETVRAMLPLYSSLLAPKLERAAIVGLGAGTSLAIVANLQESKKIDVIEISPSVVKALPYFHQFNSGLEKNLQKVDLKVGDAFQKLREQNFLYDLVLCEPTNLWIPGVEKLYTAEFFSLISDKTSENGLFALWVPIGALSPSTTSLIISTLNQVFPYVTIWNSGFATITLVASKKPLELLPTPILQQRFNDNLTFFKRLKIENYDTMLAGQLATAWMTKSISLRDGRVNMAEYPTIAFSAARSRFADYGTNFDEFLSEKTLQLADSEDPNSRFLLQPTNTSLTADQLTDIVNFYQRIGRVTSKIFELKWLYLNEKLGRPTRASPQSVTYLRELLDGGNQNTTPSLTRTEALLKSYQQARIMGLNPSAQPILTTFDWTCDSILCAKLALWALQEFLPPAEGLKIRQSQPNFSSLATRQELIGRLKKFKEQQ